MHRRRIQRIVADHDPQESGCLLEGLVAQPRHALQRRARRERTLGVAIVDDALGHAGVEAGDPRQQRRGRGIHVDADRIDALLDRSQEVRRVASMVILSLSYPPHYTRRRACQS